jgi:hypothetical protein
MKTELRRNLLLALTFLAGCVVSRVQLIPPALAQSDTSTTRWEYFCMTPEYPLNVLEPESLTAQLKPVGQQGWELVLQDRVGNYCFKRPQR